LAKDVDDFALRDLAGGAFIAQQRNVVLVGGTEPGVTPRPFEARSRFWRPRTRFTDSRALHRLGRSQAAILTLRRRAHHHRLCIGLPEARSIRAPHQYEPRIGRSRRGGWVTGASCAPRLTTTQCSTPNGKPVLSAHGARLW
jgi:hypothetical protein